MSVSSLVSFPARFFVAASATVLLRVPLVAMLGNPAGADHLHVLVHQPAGAG
jgi:hypothetical protein